MHQEHNNTITQNNSNNLSPALVAFLPPLAWKRAGLLSQDKVSKEVCK